MRKKVSYRLGLLIILFSGWSAIGMSESDFYSVHSTQSKTMLDLPQEDVLTPGEDHSIPRNQVLLEITTGTW